MVKSGQVDSLQLYHLLKDAVSIQVVEKDHALIHHERSSQTPKYKQLLCLKSQLHRLGSHTLYSGVLINPTLAKCPVYLAKERKLICCLI